MERGILWKHDRNTYSGLILNLAARHIHGTDLIDFMPQNLAQSLATDLFNTSVRISRSRNISLLHADYLTSHYFEFDAFILTPSGARLDLLRSLRDLLRILPINTIACTISPHGLVGTYPLCFYLAVQNAHRLAVSIVRRGETLEFVGDVLPKTSRCIILSDVITTGTSIIKLRDQLRSVGAKVVGVLAIYDRDEGGRQRLEAEGLPTISVLSSSQLRKLCQATLLSNKPAGVAAKKARLFLQATNRVTFVKHQGTRTPQHTVTLLLAPGLAPPLSAFDAALRFRRRSSSAQQATLDQLLSIAHDEHPTAIILPELSIPRRALPAIAAASRNSRTIIIGGCEYDEHERNSAVIAIDGLIVEQRKLVRSPYDRQTMAVGDEVHVFKHSYLGNFAVLVCADQAEYRIIEGLKNEVDLLVVVARNRAISTFASIGVGDAYRLYCYVVVVNARDAGRSCLISPQKGDAKLQWLTAGEGELVRIAISLQDLKAKAPSFLQKVSDPTIDAVRWRKAP